VRYLPYLTHPLPPLPRHRGCRIMASKRIGGSDDITRIRTTPPAAAGSAAVPANQKRRATAATRAEQAIALLSPPKPSDKTVRLLGPRGRFCARNSDRLCCQS
jgi:hypothetical protein